MEEIKQALIRVEEPAFDKNEIYRRLENLPGHIRPLQSQVAGHELGKLVASLFSAQLKEQ